MPFMILEKPAKTIASYRVTGPYATTVKQGFDVLIPWAKQLNLQDADWLTLFLDNPNTTDPQTCRAEPSVSVSKDFQLPDNSAGIRLQTLPAGTYAAYHITIGDGNFAKAWTDFFTLHLANSGYRPDGRVCYEHYLNDGSLTGVFEVVLYQSVEKIAVIR